MSSEFTTLIGEFRGIGGQLVHNGLYSPKNEEEEEETFSTV